MTQADTGRAVAWQVAQAVQAGREQSYEILLNPPELGKLRISLTPGETGISISIQADRPETLDLLRRHADMLSQDFREMGYDSTAFSFGAETGEDRPRDTPAEDDGSASAAETQHAEMAGGMPVSHAPAAASAANRVDIRL
ncbi:flagellar hook-length control protein FliK [Roseovarius salis]|uniref:flagellar hook-length control protein FliK n=1 Tax=Roseovarius salis TaxID=3376063 RepID=UPI0037C8EDC2